VYNYSARVISRPMHYYLLPLLAICLPFYALAFYKSVTSASVLQIFRRTWMTLKTMMLLTIYAKSVTWWPKEV